MCKMTAASRERELLSAIEELQISVKSLQSELSDIRGGDRKLAQLKIEHAPADGKFLGRIGRALAAGKLDGAMDCYMLAVLAINGEHAPDSTQRRFPSEWMKYLFYLFSRRSGKAVHRAAVFFSGQRIDDRDSVL